MPELPQFVMPRDAFEKTAAKAATIDHYSDLTDEERAEENLPPRPAAEPEKPAVTEPVTQPAAPKVEPAKEEPAAPAEIGASAQDLLDEIAAMHTTIAERLGAAEQPAVANGNGQPKDDVVQRALEDPDVDETTRALAETVMDLRERLAQLEPVVHEERVDKYHRSLDAQFEHVQQTYTVGGKPLTDEHVAAVEGYLLKNPELAKKLTVEEATRVALPEAVRSGVKPAPQPPPPPTKTKETPAVDGQVATIVDVGANGGGAPAPFKPRPNESIESAVREYGRRAGWVRG